MPQSPTQATFIAKHTEAAEFVETQGPRGLRSLQNTELTGITEYPLFLCGPCEPRVSISSMVSVSPVFKKDRPSLWSPRARCSTRPWRSAAARRSGGSIGRGLEDEVVFGLRRLAQPWIDDVSRAAAAQALHATARELAGYKPEAFAIWTGHCFAPGAPVPRLGSPGGPISSPSILGQPARPGQIEFADAGHLYSGCIRRHGAPAMTTMIASP
jgi:hypothetical protein